MESKDIADNLLKQSQIKVKEQQILEQEQREQEEKMSIKDEKTKQFMKLKEDSEKAIELFEATDKLDSTEQNKAKNLQLSERVKIFRKQIYTSLINFPKHERYSLTQNIKNDLIMMSAEIERARYTPQARIESLKTAQQCLYRISIMVDIARDAKYISQKYYDTLSIRLTEISKMLVGYIKYASNLKNKGKIETTYQDFKLKI